jgi:hypothetical protein
MEKFFEGFEKVARDYFHGGLADNKPDEKYDKKQIHMGTNVEMEHTNDRKKAKEIAKDHLEEHGKYYTALKKMEDNLESEKAAGLSFPYYLAQFVRVKK